MTQQLKLGRNELSTLLSVLKKVKHDELTSSERALLRRIQLLAQ